MPLLSALALQTVGRVLKAIHDADEAVMDLPPRRGRGGRRGRTGD